MSTQAADHGHELVPQPDQTPDALRAALAVVAPGRLAEMQRTKDEAFAKAVEWQSLSPVQSWVLAWARDIEIARRPDLSARTCSRTEQPGARGSGRRPGGPAGAGHGPGRRHAGSTRLS